VEFIKAAYYHPIYSLRVYVDVDVDVDVQSIVSKSISCIFSYVILSSFMPTIFYY